MFWYLILGLSHTYLYYEVVMLDYDYDRGIHPQKKKKKKRS